MSGTDIPGPDYFTERLTQTDSEVHEAITVPSESLMR